ncbi:MAG: Yip1 family protein [Shimia sp.]
MSITTNILRSYTRPRQVMRRMLDGGDREDRAIAILAGGCLMLFVANWPRIAREAETTGGDLTQQLSYALFGTLFILPLLLYGIGAIGHILAKPFGGRGSWYGARLALFWALLATAPILVLWGLVQGFIGPGTQANLVGLLWFGAFLALWTINLREAERG